MGGQIGAISEAMGFDSPSALFTAISMVALSIVFGIIVYVAIGTLIGRLKNGSGAKGFFSAIQGPVALLTFLVALLNNISLIVPGTVSTSWFESIDTIQSLLVIATLMWVMLRYIRSIEASIEKKTQEDGSIVLPLVGKKIEGSRMQLMFKLLRVSVVIIVILMLLQAFGVSITGLLAFGGVGGIIVGFAAHDVISNAFIGLRIFISRPFDVGEWIKCADIGVEGTVEEIGWQMTMVRTFDKRPLYVPNSVLANTVIENPQRMTNRRFYEYFGLRYTDMETLTEVLRDVRDMLDNHPEIDQNMIKMVNLDRFGAYSVDFFVYCMTKTTDWKRFHEIKEELLLTIAAIVHKNGADFAFPTQTMHLEGESQRLVPEPDLEAA